MSDAAAAEAAADTTASEGTDAADAVDVCGSISWGSPVDDAGEGSAGGGDTAAAGSTVDDAAGGSPAEVPSPSLSVLN